MSFRSAGPADTRLVADLVRAAFQPVAARFGLDRDNAPTHPSNCEPSWIERDFDRGIEYRILELDGEAVGCFG